MATQRLRSCRPFCAISRSLRRRLYAVFLARLDRIVARCLRKDAERRYQHAGDLKIDLQQVQEELASGDSEITRDRKIGMTMARWWWIVAATAFSAISLTVAWWLHGLQVSPPPWKLTRLTHDTGLSDFAALSPDGKLAAYTSDHGLDDGLDLDVKQVAGGQPLRLTWDGAGNTTPDFSPDGTKIAFRSNRDGGGIYEISAFGGEARLLARDGLNPKFSPDGLQVAYWIGNEGLAAAIPGSSTVWVIPVTGGPPQRVGPNFTAARIQSGPRTGSTCYSSDTHRRRYTKPPASTGGSSPQMGVMLLELARTKRWCTPDCKYSISPAVFQFRRIGRGAPQLRSP